MKFLKNYDCIINYHLEKANVVADALSQEVQVAGLIIKEWNMLKKISECNPRI